MSEMIEVDVAELGGPALDWAVAKAVGHDVTFGHWGDFHYGAIIPQPVRLFPDQNVPFSPSTEWRQGGPLIEEHGVEAGPAGTDEWRARKAGNAFVRGVQFGPTLLIAAMRAIVAAEIGDRVNVPAELMEATQ